MTGSSLDIKEAQLAKLKELFPEAVSEGRIDWEKLRLTLGDDVAIGNERYVLNWAGKTDAFRAIQTPTAATLKHQRGQSVDFDTTQNVFIEGENLEVLKVLQKSYYGKVKMIYIDPPYNTGNDSFIYPDKFSETKEEYLKRIGDKDEAGYLTKEGFFRRNSKENGQFHSNWLSMMYPRLFLARNLLREDGVIFVSIDDNEVHNLRLMMNEIFGEENRIESFVWKKSYGGGAKEKYAVTQHEHILFYAKNLNQIEELWLPPDPDAEKRYYKYKDEKFKERGPYRLKPLEATKSMDRRENLVFPIAMPSGVEIFPKRQWWWSYERVKRALNNNELVFIGNGDAVSVSYKQYLRDEDGNIRGAKPFSIVDGIYTQQGTEDLLRLFSEGSPFQFPKPVELVMKLISIGTNPNKGSIIFDFFSGSGTTAQAVFELNKEDGGNRKFVLVQLPEKTDEDSEAFKAGYKTIADICKERIRRVSKRIKDETLAKPDLFKDKPLDLGFKVFTLEPSNFKIWRTDVLESEADLKRQMEVFVDPVRGHSETDDMAWELALKLGYELTASISKSVFGGVPAYVIADPEGNTVLLLESITQAVIEPLTATKPKRVVALDRLFAGHDQLKTNTVLQMKDAGVEFWTI